MNYKQVTALRNLMERALPPRPLYADEGEPNPELHVSLEVSHGYDDGNTYEARLWTIETGVRFPDEFYLRSDGVVYVYDSERDVSHEISGVTWEYVKRYHRWDCRTSLGGLLKPLPA